MTLVLTHNETGRTLNEGTMLLHPQTRESWRFESIVVPAERSKHTDPMIRVSKHHPKMGRVVRVMSAHIFGCAVVVVVPIWHNYNKIKDITKGFVNLTWAGILAWMVLAVADHFHGAEHLFELFH